MTKNIDFPDISEMLNLKKKLESKTRADKPQDSELTAATFKMMCDFLPSFIEGMADLKNISSSSEGLKMEIASLKEDVKAYKDEISTMRNEMKEIQTENKAEIIVVKEQNASLRKVLEDHTSVFEVMQRKMAEYEKKFLTLEVEKSESCVLIRNFVGGGAKETRQTLCDSFQKLLQFLRLDNRIKVLDVF